MEYRIVFYTTEAGETPVAEFLDSLRGRNDVLHKLITAGLRTLKDRSSHGPPLTTAIEGTSSLYELRVGGADIARVFFFFQPGRQIVCTHGYVKKSQQLDRGEINRAERYRADWERRHPGTLRR